MLLSLSMAVLLGPPPAGLETRWSTEPACVEAEILPDRVVALMGRAAPQAQLGLGAERRGDGWRIFLELEPLGGSALRRTLEGRDCATLTDAVALVVAVRLDAVAVAATIAGASKGAPATEAEPQPGEPEPAQVGVPDPPPPRWSVPGAALHTDEPRLGEHDDGARREPERADRPALDEPSAPPGRPRVLLGAGVAGELGVLPRGAAAFALATGVAWTHALVELGGSASVGSDVASEDLPTVGGRFRLFAAALRGCRMSRGERVALPLCGGIELGDLRARGLGLRRPSTIDALWVAAVVSARPQWMATPRLSVGAALDLVAPLRRHRFAIAEVGRVHEVAPVAVRLGLRLELRLP